ncbi:hypothetical protein MH928_02670 [Flavobacterium sp. WW92]|uniref:hypothetical protein n=1 Tax=unclassified Flavobacterium TaxID=196869 RepID=UPI002224490E|nr:MULTISPECIES: hypothetical protein [unclassified Flavobacterium]WDO13613.1 hypothetical protein MH928_02670 [Flavobacterium sp. WW92]
MGVLEVAFYNAVQKHAGVADQGGLITVEQLDFFDAVIGPCLGPDAPDTVGTGRGALVEPAFLVVQIDPGHAVYVDALYLLAERPLGCGRDVFPRLQLFVLVLHRKIGLAYKTVDDIGRIGVYHRSSRMADADRYLFHRLAGVVIVVGDDGLVVVVHYLAQLEGADIAHGRLGAVQGLVGYPVVSGGIGRRALRHLGNIKYIPVSLVIIDGKSRRRKGARVIRIDDLQVAGQVLYRGFQLPRGILSDDKPSRMAHEVELPQVVLGIVDALFLRVPEKLVPFSAVRRRLSGTPDQLIIRIRERIARSLGTVDARFFSDNQVFVRDAAYGTGHGPAHKQAPPEAGIAGSLAGGGRSGVVFQRDIQADVFRAGRRAEYRDADIRRSGIVVYRHFLEFHQRRRGRRRGKYRGHLAFDFRILGIESACREQDAAQRGQKARLGGLEEGHVLVFY